MKELSDCTVLVVDDTEANVDILVDAVGETYDVSVAMNGQAALEAVEENPPDLILLDADQELIHRALRSILDNAIRYSPESSQVFCTTNCLITCA